MVYKSKLSPTAIRLFELMQPETPYTTAQLGYLVFGECKANGLRRAPQGSALAVGRFMLELEERKMIVHSFDSTWGRSLRYYKGRELKDD